MRILSWLVLLPGLVWAVVRIGGLETGRAVQLIAFTPYVAAGSLLLTVLLLAFRRWQPGVAALAITFALAACVLPRAVPAWHTGPARGVTLRVMSANLLLGTADPEAVLSLVRSGGVEVLALQEFSPQAQNALSAAGIDALLPYHSLAASPGADGSALYAKYPVTGQGYRNDGFRQAYGVVQPPGAAPVLVESAHPIAPTDPQQILGWQRTMEALPRAGGPIPRILLGDFNATLDSARLRRLMASGYRDAAATLGDGLIGTWGPYDGDLIPPVTIDHVLVDNRIGVRGLDVHDLVHSDHRAVRATLTIPEATQ